MTIPRKDLVDPENPGCYHLFSRCVRRAWLCGEDPVTGRSFEHRRQWLEDRLLFLCQHFAVSLYAYAIMSNHYHMVVRLDPKAPQRWSDVDVATRWVALSPRRSSANFEELQSARIESICQDPEALQEYRSRLGSLSWLMRLLNEPIARRANREDDCTGHFWEGRFESKTLLDDLASLSAAAYVDLNPVRANATSDPLTAPHTSIRRRLDTVSSDLDQRHNLPPVVSGLTRQDHGLPIGLQDYCALLRWSSEPSGNSHHAPPVPLIGGPRRWLSGLARLKRHDLRAFGELHALEAYAKRIGQRWIRGIGEARREAAQYRTP